MDPRLVTKINAYVGLFFGVGMLLFTEELMGMYKVEISAGVRQMAKLNGWALLFASMYNMVCERINNKKSTSLANFANMLQGTYNVAFAAFKLKPWMEARNIDTGGAYVNMAMFGVLAYLSFTAWQATGSETPSFTPFGDMSKMVTALRVNNFIGIGFGVQLAFNQQMMFDTYIKGVEFSGEDMMDMKMMMFGIGMGFLFNVLRSECLISGGDEEVIYAILRANAMAWCVNMGICAAQRQVNTSLGWPNDMYYVNAAMAFGMAFYSAKTLANEDKV